MPHLLRSLLISTLFFLVLQTAALGQNLDGVMSANLTCADLNGAYVFSQETTPVYLGFFGSSIASDSIMYEFGAYGSSIRLQSVRNENGA